MGFLVSFLLTAFPLELDAGLVPVEGRLPRLVMAGSTPVLVWVDGRRQWLDGRDAGALFFVELPDGGADTSGRPVLENLQGGAPEASDGLAVAGGQAGQVLVVWQGVDHQGLPVRRFAVRPGAGAAFLEGVVPPSSGPARPVAAAWAGDAGLVSWPTNDGGQEIRWVDRLAVLTPQRASLGSGGVRQIAASADPSGGARVAWTTGGDWVSGVFPPNATSVPSLLWLVGDFQWLAIEPRGAALVTHQANSTEVLRIPSGSEPPLFSVSPVTEPPAIAQLQPSGDFVVGRVTQSMALLNRLGTVQFAFATNIGPARSVSVVALPTSNRALSVTDHAVTGELTLRSVQQQTGVGSPASAARMGAMRRSPTIAWGTDRWIVAWEEGPSLTVGTRVVTVFPDSGVDMASFPLDAQRRPQLDQLEDGGLLLTTSENEFLRSIPLRVNLMTGTGPVFAPMRGSTHVALTRPGLVQVGPGGELTFVPVPTPSSRSPIPNVEAVSGLDGRAWVLFRDGQVWRLRVVEATGRVLLEVELFSESPPFTPRQGVLSVRRSATGQPMALAGIREGPQVRWSVVLSDGGVLDAGTMSNANTVRGLGVTAAGNQWIRSMTTASGPTGPRPQAELQQVLDDGTVTQLMPFILESAEPGVPVLAAGPPGQVAVVVPVLVAEDPRLRMTVVEVSTRTVPVEPDGGSIADAGVFTDGGMAIDAGGFIDAGDLDAGVTDAGQRVEAPSIIFVPNGCGCGAVDLSFFGGALLLLRRRRVVGRTR